MHDETQMQGCSYCGCQCRGNCACQCGCGTRSRMEMWMNMPKEMRVAKLEKKEAMIKAELDFIGKMKQMAQKMPEEKK